ncbi:helix-turn-helix transcriptional regulator [Actinoplanes subglobosus]|uniref:LuxR C-terminal-related transcriptional regulator n=1 Tax=Actinoplanes subglobosus TaxID=1547892 RepID=A0ABV8IRV6_9ACTN
MADETTTNSSALATVYEWILRSGNASEEDSARIAVDSGLPPEVVREQLTALIELRLLRESPQQPGELLPCGPDSAIADLVNPIEIAIKEQERRAADLRFQLTSLSAVYHESRQDRNRQKAIDVVADVAQVRVLLSDISRQCSVEIFSAHPGVLSEAAIASSQNQDLDLLGRGVRMRAMYQHPVRVNPRMRESLGVLTDAGCQVRTADEIPDRIVIFDRDVAVIPNRMGSEGAVVIREPSIVDHLYRALERVWSLAVPLANEEVAAVGYGMAGDELKRAVIRLLAAGAKDDFIARRLSISVRTCRRHIAEILDELQATSRFQAGVLLARNGMLDPP